MKTATKEVIDYVFRYVLALTIVIGFIVLMIFLFTHNTGGMYTETITLCIGAIIGSYTTIISYEWGSSKGSSDKNQMLLNSTPTDSQK